MTSKLLPLCVSKLFLSICAFIRGFELTETQHSSLVVNTHFVPFPGLGDVSHSFWGARGGRESASLSLFVIFCEYVTKQNYQKRHELMQDSRRHIKTQYCLYAEPSETENAPSLPGNFSSSLSSFPMALRVKYSC